MRGRLLLLGLLLAGTALSVVIYQLASSSPAHSKILPSHPIRKDVLRGRAGASDDDDDDSEVLTTGTGISAEKLEELGNSDLARALRQQALRNRKEAARLVEERKRLDGEFFRLKVERSRHEGLRMKLEEDMETLKRDQRLLEEEKKQLAIERIYGGPAPQRTEKERAHSRNTEGFKIDDRALNEYIQGLKSKVSTRKPESPPNFAKRNVPGNAQPPPLKHQRNPLSVQGANLQRYLKEAKKKFKYLKSSNQTANGVVTNANNGEKKNFPSEQIPQPLEGRVSQSQSVPAGTSKGQGMKSDWSVLDQLPKVDYFVQQGHFGYEHGRNGKGASDEEPDEGRKPGTDRKGKKDTDDASESNTQQHSPSKDPNDMWEGLNPLSVIKRYPGIMLDGSYMLRQFIDPSDVRASGMEGNPHSIDEMSEAAAEERFYQLVTIDHMHCAEIQRMGNYGDGGWDMCVSAPYKPNQSCLVYSFGINNDFSFDDGISNKYGCEVKAFDPSMNVGDHMHSSKVHFFNLGLGAADGINDQAWQLRTFGSILKRLGHSTHILDFLKIDIEFNEWDCFRTMLREKSLRNVKQLVFEIHTSEVYSINRPSRKENFLEWYNLLHGLEEQGFRRYHHHFNPSGQYTSVRTGKGRTCCYELYYVNIHFLK